jgi:hypothetical protein
MWYSSEAMAMVERSDGEIGKNFPSNDKLDARLEVVRGSWKGLQNPFPASVQADVRLGMFNQ